MPRAQLCYQRAARDSQGPGPDCQEQLLRECPLIFPPPLLTWQGCGRPGGRSRCATPGWSCRRTPGAGTAAVRVVRGRYRWAGRATCALQQAQGNAMISPGQQEAGGGSPGEVRSSRWSAQPAARCSGAAGGGGTVAQGVSGAPGGTSPQSPPARSDRSRQERSRPGAGLRGGTVVEGGGQLSASCQPSAGWGQVACKPGICWTLLSWAALHRYRCQEQHWVAAQASTGPGQSAP